MFRPSAIIVLTLLLNTYAVSAAQVAPKSARPSLTKIRISQSAVNTRSAILWIAQGQGLFAKNGLEVETIYLRSSNLQMAAMATGDVQFASSGGAPVLSAVSGGQDLKIVASPSNRLAYDVVVRPEIREARDLRGKRFGVTNIGGTTWMAAILALEHLGLDYQRDQIRINALGNQTILAQAVEAGNIDATLLDPFLSRRLKQKGLSVLIDLYRAKIPFINTSLIVNGTYLKENPEIVESVLRSILEAQAFVAAAANKYSVLQTMARQMKITDPTILEEGYQEILVGFEKKPYPSIDGLRNIQRMMNSLNPKVTRLKAEDIIESRFVRKLDESGYIDNLFAKGH
ncbi:MAG TPA: NrtA/SsuA/CpmA family ABC transporter substrate-binding protein [Candidatus Binatia bacterium]|nr:NrtA/SsuA/CpmA family ABC transporter substrate-binding protein [Candidatus Binatia bacterium]